MKKKLLKIKGQEMATVGQRGTAGSGINVSAKEKVQAASIEDGAVVTRLEFPPPEHLLEAARGEPNRKLIEDYREAIGVLRDEKGFSFREIAEWLTENGVDADYNAVYRVYTKGMSEDQERDVALRETDEERDEIQR